MDPDALVPLLPEGLEAGVLAAAHERACEWARRAAEEPQLRQRLVPIFRAHRHLPTGRAPPFRRAVWRLVLLAVRTVSGAMRGPGLEDWRRACEEVGERPEWRWLLAFEARQGPRRDSRKCPWPSPSP